MPGKVIVLDQVLKFLSKGSQVSGKRLMMPLKLCEVGYGQYLWLQPLLKGKDGGCRLRCPGMSKRRDR